MKELNEINEIVEKINNEIYEILPVFGTEYTYPVTYESDGNEYCIKFLDMPLWTSANDEREFIDEVDDYEDLEKFIRKSINDFISEIKKIKV